MIESAFDGLLLILQWKALAFMLLGIFLGFWVGLLPGLGGVTTLALMLPFIYAMKPHEATVTRAINRSGSPPSPPPTPPT